jgi:hypothetical protein
MQEIEQLARGFFKPNDEASGEPHPSPTPDTPCQGDNCCCDGSCCQEVDLDSDSKTILDLRQRLRHAINLLETITECDTEDTLNRFSEFHQTTLDIVQDLINSANDILNSYF